MENQPCAMFGRINPQLGFRRDDSFNSMTSIEGKVRLMITPARSVFTLFLGFMLVGTPLPSIAQEPSDLTIIVPLGEGGALDKMARNAAKYLPDVGDYRVTVENRVIKGDRDGYQDFLDRPADGSTILAWFEPAASTYKRGVDLDDLAIINVQEIEPPILAARSDLGWKTFEDFVNAAKLRPGYYRIGAGKAGGNLDLMERQFRELGIEVKQVDYASGGQARKGITNDEIDLTIGSLKALKKLKSKIIPLVVMAPRRLRLWREVPSISEALAASDAAPIHGASYRFFAVRKQVLALHPETFDGLSSAFKRLNTENEGFLSKYNGQQQWIGHLDGQSLINRIHSHFLDLQEKTIRPASARHK